ncbi:MAG: hypothetical protein U9N06_01095 [candidate division WOR-3 bacterium]|nr:hypothetical protein [candidate division WOR-3 bacterium]
MKPNKPLHPEQKHPSKIHSVKEIKFRENEKDVFSIIYTKVDKNDDYGA